MNKQSLRKLIRESISSLLNEYEIFDYKQTLSSPESKNYKFFANGLRYFVNIWHDMSMHDFGTFEIEFGIDEQKNAGHRTKKDLQHLNSVLYTVMDIAEKETKKSNIKKYKIEGARGEGDSTFLFDQNVRSKIYLRFLKNRYPQEGAIDTFGRYINIDMTKIFPENYSTEKFKVDIIIDELVRISDEDPNRDAIKRGLSGSGDDDFGISSDYIVNSKYGEMFFEISVNKHFKEYDLNWESFETGDSKQEYFDNFKDLVKYLRENF